MKVGVERGVTQRLGAFALALWAVAVVSPTATATPLPTQLVDTTPAPFKDLAAGLLLAASPPAPGVLLPPRPPATLATWSIRLPVPLIRQIGDKSNCGPTAAAMVAGAYAGQTSPSALRDLRNAIGEWTWQRFPRRQRAREGSDAGGTTRVMMQQALDRFSGARWQEVDHPFIPKDLWAIVALRRHLAERRPVVILAEAAPLWGVGASGLHWVVATGLDAGQVLFHDPADGAEAAIPFETFWRAWRLPAEWRPIAGRGGFEALVADRSLPPPLEPVLETRHVAHEALLQH
jgi:hypothetical protein